jgi:hypothetical protein
MGLDAVNLPQLDHLRGRATAGTHLPLVIDVALPTQDDKGPVLVAVASAISNCLDRHSYRRNIAASSAPARATAL